MEEDKTNSNELFDPLWFYDHNYENIVNNIKNPFFIENCITFIDENNNNLLHYLYFNLSLHKFTKNIFNITKWLCNKNKNIINQKNNNHNTPFYYFIDYYSNKDYVNDENEIPFNICFDSLINLDFNIPNNSGDNIVHILCKYSKIYDNKFLNNILINKKYEKLYKCKNNNKQYPLHIALGTFRDKSNKNYMILLNYIFNKTIELLPYCITSTDNKGRNIYHLCLEYNHIELCKYIWNNKNSSKIVNLPLQNEHLTPNIFIVLINKYTNLIQFLYVKNPEIFCTKDKNNHCIFDILYEYYLLTKDIFYFNTFKLFLTKEYIYISKKLFNENYKKLYNNMIFYEKYDNYTCNICYQQVDDIRKWERPFVCKNHSNLLFHTSCIETWFNIQKNCPICSYK